MDSPTVSPVSPCYGRVAAPRPSALRRRTLAIVVVPEPAPYVLEDEMPANDLVTPYA